MRSIVPILLLNVGYGVVGFLLYRGRGLYSNVAFESDTVVFAAPAVVALALNIWLLGRIVRTDFGRGRLITIAVFGGAALTAVTAFGYAFAALNLLGA